MSLPGGFRCVPGRVELRWFARDVCWGLVWWEGRVRVEVSGFSSKEEALGWFAGASGKEVGDGG